MDQVMFQPLDERKRRFLLANGLAESFTREQAACLWQEPDSDALLDALTQENAFISREGESGVYRYHNMLRDVVRSRFKELPAPEQGNCLAGWGVGSLGRGNTFRPQRPFTGPATGSA